MSPLRRPVRSILSPRTVKDLGTLAEVDLRHLAGVELQYGGDLWVSGLDACEETAHRGVRAGEAVAANQGAVDGGALDSLTPPTRDPLAIRFSLRGDRGLCAHRTQVHGKPGVAGQPRRDPGRVGLVHAESPHRKWSEAKVRIGRRREVDPFQWTVYVLGFMQRPSLTAHIALEAGSTRTIPGYGLMGKAIRRVPPGRDGDPCAKMAWSRRRGRCREFNHAQRGQGQRSGASTPIADGAKIARSNNSSLQS